MSTRAVGAANLSFIRPKRLCPPASTLASSFSLKQLDRFIERCGRVIVKLLRNHAKASFELEELHGILTQDHLLLFLRDTKTFDILDDSRRVSPWEVSAE